MELNIGLAEIPGALIGVKMGSSKSLEEQDKTSPLKPIVNSPFQETLGH
jgi:hypothetical protein